MREWSEGWGVVGAEAVGVGGKKEVEAEKGVDGVEGVEGE